MITLEKAKPGSIAIYKDGTEAIIITGHYVEEGVGLILKTSKFPGGFPSEHFTLKGEEAPTELAVVIEAEPVVTFELAIINDKTPVKLTAAIITEKSKVLTDLKIANMFDEKGYEAVKKALSSKAVKTRTGIEKQHKEVLTQIKSRHASELKEVNDYAEELYVACRAVEKDLRDKLTLVDTQRKDAADKLAAEEKERTEARENKMFNLGMVWNGQAFVGYGKSYTKEQLHGFITDFYNSLVVELEGLQMETEVTGKESEHVTPVHNTNQTNYQTFGTPGSYAGGSSPSLGAPKQQSVKAEYPTAVYDHTLPDGTRIVLTKGECTSIELGAIVTNDRVGQSGVYVQVIK